MDAPLTRRPTRVEIGQGEDLESGAHAFVIGIADTGVVLGHVREDSGQVQDPSGPSDVGDGGGAAAGALTRRRRCTLLRIVHVDVAAGLAGQPPLRLTG